MISQVELGIRLRELRESLGFSQDFVAGELDLKRQAIIAIESGSRKIDSFELFKLADLYHINAADLISGQMVPAKNFNEALMLLRNNHELSEESKKSLFAFQKICEDYEILKRL